jgi:hypothetical protein
VSVCVSVCVCECVSQVCVPERVRRDRCVCVSVCVYLKEFVETGVCVSE